MVSLPVVITLQRSSCFPLVKAMSERICLTRTWTPRFSREEVGEGVPVIDTVLEGVYVSRRVLSDLLFVEVDAEARFGWDRDVAIALGDQAPDHGGDPWRLICDRRVFEVDKVRDTCDDVDVGHLGDGAGGPVVGR